MRIVFAGTPPFAARALGALLDAGHEVTLVLTAPERRAGRGLHLGTSAVKQLAQARGLALEQPASLRDESMLARIEAARPEAIIVAAYGLLLPERALGIAPLGAWNIHASLLPRWRGAAPIQRALLAGDRETGVSIMRMDAGLDTGPVLAQRRVPIAAEDDSGTLHEQLAGLGAQMMVAALQKIAAGTAQPLAQSERDASYAPKIERHERRIDWSRPAPELERAIRAFRPAPGAHTILRGEQFKLWRARCASGAGAPGTVLDAGPAGIAVACGRDALVVTELQRPGGRRLAAGEFLRGFPIGRGERFGAAR
jgi:methionyl-tRNA formyltransferase